MTVSNGSSSKRSKNNPTLPVYVTELPLLNNIMANVVNVKHIKESQKEE
jgi:hypothetical protein